jgi:hypothetical protein
MPLGRDGEALIPGDVAVASELGRVDNAKQTIRANPVET